MPHHHQNYTALLSVFNPFSKAQSSIFMNNSFLLFFVQLTYIHFLSFCYIFLIIYLLIYCFRRKKEEFAAFTLILSRHKKIKSNSLEHCRICWLVQFDCFKSDVMDQKFCRVRDKREYIWQLKEIKKMLQFLQIFLVIIIRKEMNRREKF